MDGLVDIEKEDMDILLLSNEPVLSEIDYPSAVNKEEKPHLIVDL